MLKEIVVRPVRREEEGRYQALMQAHHYLGAVPKIGETLWYVATWLEEWVALLGFSAAALKCAARDRWIGWRYRHQFDRLKLLANNSRFLILPEWHRPNLASRTLALCERRLAGDWHSAFGHPLVLLETFVDPTRHRGTLYQASNWLYVGNTSGFRRTHGGYTSGVQSPKKIFMRPLLPRARTLLCEAHLGPPYVRGVPKLLLTAAQMNALPQFFTQIPDPRRVDGRRHPLSAVLAIAAAAHLCGARGYKAISDWADSLSQHARQRFGCRCVQRRYLVPSASIIRDVLIRVDPAHLDGALQRWNAQCGAEDASLTIDGKTMRNTIDSRGAQTLRMDDRKRPPHFNRSAVRENTCAADATRRDD
jgi:hypothetical protein